MRTSTHRVRRKQEAARAAGVCIVCFKRKTAENRVVCPLCNEGAKKRVRQRRLASRASLEDTGRLEGVGTTSDIDSAKWQNVTTESRQHLSSESRPETRSAQATWLGAKAETVLEAAYQVALGENDYDQAAEVLEQLCRQAWANANTPRGVGYARKLLALPLPRTSVWRLNGFLRLSRALTTLGRPEDALNVLREAAAACEYTKVGTLSTYLEVRAFAEHARRQKDSCLRDFQLAVEMMEALRDDWALVFALNNYAIAARDFGEESLSLTLYEKAIAASKSAELGWVTSYVVLTYINSLMVWGRFGLASIALAEATLHREHPAVAMSETWQIGILSTMTNISNKTLMDRQAIIDTAFASEEPLRISHTVAAFNRFYHEHDLSQVAHGIMGRCLDFLSGCPSTVCAPWLWCEIAITGTVAELQKALIVLSRANDEVGAALRNLMTAKLRQFEDDRRGAARDAGKAESVFRNISFRYAEAVAMELGGRFPEAREAYSVMGAQREAQRLEKRRSSTRRNGHSLTPRQEDVVRLILRGQSLKVVAAELNISEKTAEHHLSEAMQRVGVARRINLRKSPYLTYLLPPGGAAQTPEP